MDLYNKIRDVKDFPKEGILFKDITTLMQDGEAFKESIDKILEFVKDVDFDTVVAPEARGFLFGTPVSYALGKNFVPVRKPGKLPYETVSQSYDLEYGSETIEMHIDAISKGQKVVIIDDLLATGGTTKAIIDLVEKMGGVVEKLVFLIELEGLNGRELLKGYNIESVLKYDEV